MQLKGAGLLALLLAVAAWPASARGAEPRGAEAPEIPSFRPPAEEVGSALPATSAGSLLGARGYFVREVRVLGSGVVGASVLAERIAPYEGRWLSYDELLNLRDAITLAYVERGYVTSGALLDRLPSPDGVLEIHVVEGALTRVQITGQRYFREQTLVGRLRENLEAPLNVLDLEDDLQVLQQDARIRRVEAELIPEGERGRARLLLNVEERSPLRVEVGVGNDISPAVGDAQLALQLSHLNLTGHGDTLLTSIRQAEGLRDVRVAYRHPLPIRGLELGWTVRSIRSEIVEEPFDALDIESEATTYGVELEQTLHQTARTRVSASVAFERRRSRSFLLGRGFPFAEGVDADGTARLSVLEAGQAWTYRDRRQVAALRSSLRMGIDAFDATIQDGRGPDGRFLVWRVQAQWARRLPVAEATLDVRAEAQLANDPLLGVEQLSLGGPGSVRGYRESARVGDSGWLGSVELAAPVPIPGAPASPRGRGLQVRAFADVGRVHNEQRATPSVRTLSSVGVGLRYEAALGLAADLSFAVPLRDLDVGAEDRLQDRGVRFRLTWAY